MRKHTDITHASAWLKVTLKRDVPWYTCAFDIIKCLSIEMGHRRTQRPEEANCFWENPVGSTRHSRHHRHDDEAHQTLFGLRPPGSVFLLPLLRHGAQGQRSGPSTTSEASWRSTQTKGKTKGGGAAGESKRRPLQAGGKTQSERCFQKVPFPHFPSRVGRWL